MKKKHNDKQKSEESVNKNLEEELTAEADQEIEQIDSALRDAQDAASAATKQNENQRVENLENQLRRAVADYQNLEKRTEDQKSAWILSANKDLILRLLPGIDNLLLADKHTEDTGIKIAIKHFMEILEQDGVEKIKTENADFDPNLMEAVSTIEVDSSTDSGQMEGKVVEEIKAGYTLNGDLIRPAQVIVGSAKQN